MTAFRSLEERYEYVGGLGSGGMSTVYKARDKVLDRLVAIKRVIGGLHNESMFLRFEREAKAYAALRHPNIVSVFDFGTDENNKPFLVMDFVEGETLDEVIAGGALPLDNVIEIFLQLLDGLSHAHRNRIVHRDLKPTNVMVQGTGAERKKLSVKLMDFGIAKLQDETAESAYLTQPGSVIGSPLYMSPEQGSAVDVDARSDIYSVGCMLFEAFTGAPPYKGDTFMMTILAHRTAELPPMTDHLAKFGAASKDLESILRKALQKQPENRFQSAEEMRQALLAVDEKLKGHHVDNLGQREREVQRRAKKKQLLLYGSAVLATIAVGVIAYVGETMIEKLSDASFQLNEKGKHVPSQGAYINDERHDYWRENNNNKEHELPDAPSPITRLKKPAQVACISLGRGLPLVTKHDSPTQSQKDLLVGIDQLPNLSIVVLNNFCLGTDEFKLLSGIRGLQSLTFSDCRIGVGCIEVLRGSKYLRKLNFKDCDLDDLSEVRQLQGLEEMLLPGLDLSKPGSLVPISQLKTMKILNLQDSSVTDQHLTELTKLKKLVRLNLCGCPITSEGCKTLAQIDSLEQLMLDYTKVGDEGLKYLAKLPNLETLLVNLTTVSDSGLMQLSRMPKLRRLEVDQSKCTLEGVNRLKAKCPLLRVNRKGDPNEVQKEFFQ